jgi:hypothetical protein
MVKISEVEILKRNFSKKKNEYHKLKKFFLKI